MPTTCVTPHWRNASIAAALGYASESAFGAAFKRTMGCSPRQYARSDASAA
jgi:AraC-like DNA-binding protein